MYINVGCMLKYAHFVYDCKCVACELFTLFVYVNVWVHAFISFHMCVWVYMCITCGMYD